MWLWSGNVSCNTPHLLKYIWFYKLETFDRLRNRWVSLRAVNSLSLIIKFRNLFSRSILPHLYSNTWHGNRLLKFRWKSSELCTVRWSERSHNAHIQSSIDVRFITPIWSSTWFCRLTDGTLRTFKSHPVIVSIYTFLR